MSQSPVPLPPRFRMARLIASVWVPQALYAAARLGLADALASGPRTALEVAEIARSHPGATARLMRALVAIEVLRQRDDDRFELTELGRCLSSDAPDSVRSWALLWGGPMMWGPWGQLAECVRTGEMAPRLMGEADNPFDLMAAHPEDAAHFNRSMLELTRGVASLLPGAYDFSSAELVVDVGGGYGALLPPLLRARPELRAIVFDLPRCAEGAAALMAEEGLADRARFVAGDFFEEIPGGGDVYLLKSVIHDWDDAAARKILQRCREAMGPTARLLVLEWIVPERVSASDVGIVGTDLNMMVMVGGLERTEREYRALLAAAGLRVTRVIPTPAMSLIEAVAD